MGPLSIANSFDVVCGIQNSLISVNYSISHKAIMVWMIDIIVVYLIHSSFIPHSLQVAVHWTYYERAYIEYYVNGSPPDVAHFTIDATVIIVLCEWMQWITYLIIKYLGFSQKHFYGGGQKLNIGGSKNWVAQHLHCTEAPTWLISNSTKGAYTPKEKRACNSQWKQCIHQSSNE